LAHRGRKELEAKMAIVFGEKIKGLPAELQKILLDDIVPTFENRLKVLNQYNQKEEMSRKKEFCGIEMLKNETI
jgi:hypothetical protein